MSSASPSTSTHHHPSPLLCFALGLLSLFFWGMATILQIQTSEAFLLHGGAVSIMAANWTILMQPIDLMQGHLTMDMAKAVFWGWGIELVFLFCAIGYEVVHAAVKGANNRLAGWFRTGSVILIAFDAWTDLQFGQMASGFWGQVAFASITTFVVAFFGLIGLKLIEAGFAEWSRP